MKKIILAFATIIVIGGFLFYGLRSSPTPVPKQEPIKIGIAVYPGFGTFYIAEEKEFFKRHGVDVDLIQLSPDVMFSALESNQVQMLVGSSDTMAIIADTGIEAKQIFSTSISYGADGLVVKDDVQNIADLKGGKVYLTYGFPGHFFFRHLARSAGLTSSDVELVNLNSEEVGSSFIAGKIDAGMTWEPWLSNARERTDGKVLITSRDEPGLITDIVMARNDLVKNRREDVKNIMHAFFEGVDWWENNVSEGNAIVARNFNLSPEDFAPMKDTVKLSDLKTNLEMFNEEAPVNVYQIVDEASDIYLNDGVISTTTSGDAVTDATLLYDIQHEIPE